MKKTVLLVVFAASMQVLSAQTVGELAAGYLRDLIRLDTSNPPGNESKVVALISLASSRAKGMLVSDL